MWESENQDESPLMTTDNFHGIDRLDRRRTHHDALEFPDGQIALLTFLQEGQLATVLQIPAIAVGSRAPALQVREKKPQLEEVY
jgi:hypothetical protein